MRRIETWLSAARVERQLAAHGVVAAGCWVWARQWRPPVSAAEAQWDIANAYLLARLETAPMVVSVTPEALVLANVLAWRLARPMVYPLARITALTLRPDPNDASQLCLRFTCGGREHCVAVAAACKQAANWQRMLTRLGVATPPMRAKGA